MSSDMTGPGTMFSAQRSPITAAAYDGDGIRAAALDTDTESAARATTAATLGIVDQLLHHVGLVPLARTNLMRAAEDWVCDATAADEEDCVRWLQTTICEIALEGLHAPDLEQLVQTVHARIDPMLADGHSRPRLDDFLLQGGSYAGERVRAWVEACCARFPPFLLCDSDFPAEYSALTPGTWQTSSPRAQGALHRTL